MSDFIYSTKPQAGGDLSGFLSSIYSNDKAATNEFQGSWGSLAVTESRYQGFQPLETESHICLVIGGPVLYFQNNDFLGECVPCAGTRAILEHWKNGKADWSEDLSGPFVILIIDKASAQVECITDMMMFIPVYEYQNDESVLWGTHIDALAGACGEKENIDEASLVDFVLHHAVTYPYTAYENIRQCQPGTIHRLNNIQENTDSITAKADFYWQPLESNSYANLTEAATYLREGVQGYIDRVTGSLSHVAQFISAGEDSRVLAGVLPKRSQRDAYIFIDSMNREGKVAQKVAEAYDARFITGYRKKTHYLDILPEASDLIGTGHQYTHAHTLGFDKTHQLSHYRAIFGGYISDSLLKAQYAKAPRWLKRFSFLPQIAISGENRTHPVASKFFSDHMLQKITHRREEHFERVAHIRPSSAHEWFELWPATMRIAIPNLYSNRRLFASYEIFMAKESVKVAASVPVSWKLNRRLFHRAFKPFLKKSRFIMHADGRLPYYPWWVNFFLQAPTWLYQQVSRRTGLQKKNQGPWGDWRTVVTSSSWHEDVKTFTENVASTELRAALNYGALMENSSLPIASRVNFLQACYQLDKANKHQSSAVNGQEITKATA